MVFFFAVMKLCNIVIVFFFAATLLVSQQQQLIVTGFTVSSIAGRLSTLSSVAATATAEKSNNNDDTNDDDDIHDVFDTFVNFLQERQQDIIQEIETIEYELGNNTDHTFSNDRWGIFDTGTDTDTAGSNGSNGSGGITRVIQNGTIVEKGACSFTLLKGGKLTKQRAAAIRGRQQQQQDTATSTTTTDTSSTIPDGVIIQEGDTYYAAALSMVLHTRSPMIPTFRSDVRIFVVESSSSSSSSSSPTQTTTAAWFGGGSDLTPYYLFDDDITNFHQQLKDMCEKHNNDNNNMIHYPTMKQACDDYFYLPARDEHRGTGGIFFDDVPVNAKTSLEFMHDVTTTWMRSWLPIVAKRYATPYNDIQKRWQLLRRGRYLEFNLLYDRGVQFGLATNNPRVEGVMVSAPPLIAWEYNANQRIVPNSEEERLMKILKSPISWV